MRNNDLTRIVRQLILNTSFINNLGILNGKMGVAIFFYHYFLYTKDSKYRRFANFLLDEIYEDITIDLCSDFENGLSGIGWGIEYLIQNGFVKGNTNEVLADIDSLVFERDIRRIKNISLENGLKGIAHYIIIRFNNRKLETHVEYVRELLETLMGIPEFDMEIQMLISLINSILKTGNCGYINDELLDNLIMNCQFKSSDLINANRCYGLVNNGYSGIGLKMIKK